MLTPITPATRLRCRSGICQTDKTAPVVADEDRLVDLEVIEQADQIAGQMLHVIVFDRVPAGRSTRSRAGPVR